MAVRLISVLAVLAAGAVAAWTVLPESRPGAIIVAAAFVLLAAGMLAGRRGTAAPPDGGALIARRAVAFRQARAMTRAEEGEIEGAPGGPV